MSTSNINSTSPGSHGVTIKNDSPSADVRSASTVASSYRRAMGSSTNPSPNENRRGSADTAITSPSQPGTAKKFQGIRSSLNALPPGGVGDIIQPVSGRERPRSFHGSNTASALRNSVFLRPETIRSPLGPIPSTHSTHRASVPPSLETMRAHLGSVSGEEAQIKDRVTGTSRRITPSPKRVIRATHRSGVTLSRGRSVGQDIRLEDEPPIRGREGLRRATALWGRRPTRTPIFIPDPDDEHVPTDQTSRLASSVLNKLRRPNAYTTNTQAWGPSDSEIISDNIGLLLKATEKPQRHEIGSRKRSHSESRDPNDSGPNDSGLDGPSGMGRGPHKGLKRIKNNQVRVKPLVDLAVLAPQPLRIDYKTHPMEDRSDQWFITMFNKLFRMCDAFAGKFFGVHDLEQGEFFEPWEMGLSDEFISWAQQVAEEDPVMGGWDYVLRNTMQRRWLVMAILVRILKVKIFDTDLWGANEEQSELLFGIERAMLDREGFQRTELRSQTVRKILGLAPVTQNFYPEIATLTAQISLLFKPLSDYLYSIPPSTDTPLPNIEDQYQALHNIISTAAYLSLCIRISPTIFYFTDVSLGESYDKQDHWALEMDHYTASKQRVVDMYNGEWATWKADLDAADSVLQDLEKNRKIYTKETRKLEEKDRIYTLEYELATQAKADVMERAPRQPGELYKPMTKMGVWPVITRFKAGGEEDDDAERRWEKVKIEEKNGFRIFQISKAAVLVYFGERERGARVLLEEHVDGKRRMVKGSGFESVIEGVLKTGALAAAVVGLGYVLQNFGVVA